MLPRRRGGIGAPDYVGVGTSLAGIPWWHETLLRHPGVQRRRASERSPNFFMPFCDEEFTDAHLREYHAQFPRSRGRIVGEWSPRYMLDFWTPSLLLRSAPDAKLLVLLSDPVVRYRKRLRAELKRRPPEQAAYFMAETPVRGQYASQLRHLWRYFDAERTLVLQYEACRRDPVAEYRRMLAFLDLSEDFNPFGRRRARVAGRVRKRLSRRERPEDVMWPDIEAALRADLEGEMRDLKSLVPALDLSLWPSFADLADPAPAAIPGGV